MDIKRIYLVHHTHFDVGFTDMPEEVQRQQLHYLDQAVRYCRENPKYRWTIESGLLLRNYLSCRPKEAAERLLDCLRNGQMEVGAFDMQMLSETASFGELLANVSRPAELGQNYGFPVECAILDDIGGIAGELPALMNAAGIRYLLAGVGACQAELPWADLPHAFHLRSKSGGKVLVWNLGIDRNEPSTDSKYPYAVYGLGAIYLGYRGFEFLLNEHDLGITFRFPEESDAVRYSLADIYSILSKRLERENYPFEELLLQYGGDNRMPAEHIPQLVEKLNATGDFPEIELTTPRHFFHLLEDKYGTAIPEVSGVLTDPWNLRMNHVPSVTKNHRFAQRKYLAAQLKGMEDADLFESMMLVADHTFGLNNWGWQKIAADSPFGLRAPFFDRFRRSWAEKANYAMNAKHRAEVLERRTANLTVCADGDAIVVSNDAPHVVSGTAELYFSSYAPLMSSLKDRNGIEVPRQQIGLNRWIIYVKDVPALGSTRLTPAFSDKWGAVFEQKDAPSVTSIKADFYVCAFDGDGRIVSLRTRGGAELVDGGTLFGEPEIEQILDGPVENEHCSLQPCVKRERESFGGVPPKVTEDGDLFTTLVHSGTCSHGTVVVSIRLWKHLPRIDFNVRFDLPETKDKISARLLFPFAGKGAKFAFDQNAGVATPEMLLSGSIQELFFCSRFAVLNAENYSAVLCCPDAPSLEFGGKRLAEWNNSFPFVAENNHVHALIYNNICNTDAPAWYPLLDDFSYSLFLSDSSISIADAQEAWESATALNADFNSQEAVTSCVGLPRCIRMHTDEKGAPWLENFSDNACPYSFSLNGRTFTGELAPFQIAQLR
ncbi:MAG: hypothetical protein J5833_06245 [Victivallales bacterium]|nr:hypothetical protein [Victivallales bacterium]